MKHYWMDEVDGLIIVADILDALDKIEDESVEVIITDPPYELGFMGKSWDDQGVSFRPKTWEACLRVLKPGGHMIVFGGTRTHHRMWCAIEDAGFGIRDMIIWLYGQGFPKSLDVSKAIDKSAGVKRERVGTRSSYRPAANALRDPKGFQDRSDGAITIPATEYAKTWAGWGTALKPAWEPILLARKPLSEKTVAANVLKLSTGALNIDAARIEYQDDADKASATPQGQATTKAAGAIGATPDAGRNLARAPYNHVQAKGRWPANAVLQCTCADPEPIAEKTSKRRGEPSQDRRYTEDGATNFAAKPGIRRDGGGFIHEPDCPAGMLDEQTGNRPGATSPSSAQPESKFRPGQGNYMPQGPIYGDTGGASRFFYCPKASKKERGPDNNHPTVKPLELMRWLVRLVTPPEGVVLDPFCGSGSTLVAAVDEGFGFIGVDVSEEYCDIARERLVGRNTK